MRYGSAEETISIIINCGFICKNAGATGGDTTRFCAGGEKKIGIEGKEKKRTKTRLTQ